MDETNFVAKWRLKISKLLSSRQVLKPLLNKASSMERDYMDVWCNQLSLVHRTVEEETNIRGPDFNTEEVVQKYRDELYKNRSSRKTDFQ